MATVANTLKLNDRMTPALGGVVRAINSTLRAMEGMDGASSAAFRSAQHEAAITSSAVENVANSFNAIPPGARNAERGAGNSFDNMISKAAKLTAVVYGVRNAFDAMGAVADISDKITKSTARLNILADQMPMLSVGLDMPELHLPELQMQGGAQLLPVSFEMSAAEAQAQKLTMLQDQIFASAQRARSGYLDTVDAVSQLGMNAGEAFSSTDEIIAFSELMNKSFKISGADAQAQAGAMRQLTQALASGVLRGDEFNSIAEQAPMVYQAIADYMGRSKGELRGLAADGALSADIVKNAMFEAADSIEDKFSSIPTSFSDQMTKLQNIALKAFQPVLTTLNNMLNNAAVQAALDNISAGFYVLANGAQWALEKVSQAAVWAQEHIEQIKMAFIILGTVIAVVAAISAVSWAIANWPLLAMVGVIMLLVNALDYFGVTSDQVLGFVAGMFGGLYAFIYNIVAELYNVFVSFAEFFANFLNDPIGSIYRLFYSLADFVIGIMQTIASAIDAVFGSGLADAVSGWRVGLAGAVESTFGKAAIQFDRMGQMKVIDGWNKGLAVASGISGSLSNAAEKFAAIESIGIGGMDYSQFGGAGGGNPGSLGNIDKVGSVGRIEDDVTISEEDLKLLKDLAIQGFQVNYAQLNPQMSVQFGDVRETADASKILEFIEDSVAEALQSSLVVR